MGQGQFVLTYTNLDNVKNPNWFHFPQFSALQSPFFLGSSLHLSTPNNNGFNLIPFITTKSPPPLRKSPQSLTQTLSPPLRKSPQSLTQTLSPGPQANSGPSQTHFLLRQIPPNTQPPPPPPLPPPQAPATFYPLEPLYERFRKQHPLVFEATTDPLDAEEWK
ncbi:hypothetical protein PanWU01x14_062480, partial [Parasponia andersonii]